MKKITTPLERAICATLLVGMALGYTVAKTEGPDKVWWLGANIAILLGLGLPLALRLERLLPKPDRGCPVPGCTYSKRVASGVCFEHDRGGPKEAAGKPWRNDRRLRADDRIRWVIERCGYTIDYVKWSREGGWLSCEVGISEDGHHYMANYLGLTYNRIASQFEETYWEPAPSRREARREG